MKIIIQKTENNNFTTLDTEAYEKLPSPFLVDVELDKRTNEENARLHIWLRQCAKALNEQNKFYRYIHPITGLEVEKDWDERIFKEIVYRPTMNNMCGTHTTTKMKKFEPAEIAECIGRAFSMKNVAILPMWPTLL